MNFDASAANALAREVTLLGLDKDNLAIDGSMNREIAAHEGAWACELGCAGLANENFTGLYGLATKVLWMFLLVPPALTCDILYFFLNTII